MTQTKPQTSPNQYYRKHVFVCTNQRSEGDPRGCCWAKGSVRLRNYIKARTKELGMFDIRINLAGCLDRCAMGPSVVIYPEGIWYTVASEEDADELIDRHLKRGEIVDRLRMPPDKSEQTI